MSFLGMSLQLATNVNISLRNSMVYMKTINIMARLKELQVYISINSLIAQWHVKLVISIGNVDSRLMMTKEELWISFLEYFMNNKWILSGKNNDVYNILGLDKFDGHVGITRFREYKNWEFDKVTIFKLQLEEVLK